MWEEVQLKVNRDKSSFLEWRIIAEENAPRVLYSLLSPEITTISSFAKCSYKMQKGLSQLLFDDSHGVWQGAEVDSTTTHWRPKKKSFWEAVRSVSQNNEGCGFTDGWGWASHTTSMSLTFLISLLWEINEIMSIKCLIGRLHWEKQEFPSIPLGGKGNRQTLGAIN